MMIYDQYLNAAALGFLTEYISRVPSEYLWFIKFASELMEQLERAISRFRDPLQVQKAEASVERSVRHSALLEYIGECPIGISLHKAVVIKEVFAMKDAPKGPSD
jgi:hypothetical protein